MFKMQEKHANDQPVRRHPVRSSDKTCNERENCFNKQVPGPASGCLGWLTPASSLPGGQPALNCSPASVPISVKLPEHRSL